MNSRLSKWFQVMVIIFVLIHVGCAFSTLRKELDTLDQFYSLRGKVTNESPHQKDTLVLLFSETSEENIRFIHARLPDPTGHFSFEVKAGIYYILAFEDQNNNMIHDAGEYIGFFGKPDQVHVGTGTETDEDVDRRWDLDVIVSRPGDLPQGFPTQFLIDADHLNETIFRIGTVTTLDDQRFSLENARKGYWQPLTFLMEGHTGIYFLEPYDKKKIPILFIHGAVGTPMHWQGIVHHIDRSRFQPWFFYYPSGLPLDIIADGLNLFVKDLHETYGFKELVVAAHSMGGLVAKAFILKNVYQDQQDYIELFITISTPWRGHRLVKKGIEQAPTAVPSWYDMKPGSPFIESIFSKELPPSIEYYLLFSHKGSCSPFLENNDGSVELGSQLYYRAQSNARGVYGLDAGHVDVLSFLRTYNRFEQILIDNTRPQGFKAGVLGISE